MKVKSRLTTAIALTAGMTLGAFAPATALTIPVLPDLAIAKDFSATKVHSGGYYGNYRYRRSHSRKYRVYRHKRKSFRHRTYSGRTYYGGHHRGYRSYYGGYYGSYRRDPASIPGFNR